MRPGLRRTHGEFALLIRNDRILVFYPALQTSEGVPAERFAERLRRMLLALVAIVGLLAVDVAQADEIAVRDARLVAGKESFALQADFDVALTSRLENALHMGVALYFTTEFECTRPRWYWLDEQVASVSRSTRLSYHVLTRTYRLSTGTLHQSYPTLNAAMHVLGQIRLWNVLRTDQLRPETTYVAGTRMRLDVSQLPKPFQVSALANREWTLSSKWARWMFITPEGGAEAGAK